MTAVARMMQSMGMGSISSMMGLDGRGGTGFIQPASAHDTPSELVSLILRPHGGGMPMGMAGDFLGKIGMGALSYCDADQWDALSGYGALSDYVAKGREREVVTALAARPVAIATLLKWIAYMPALDKRASEEHRKWARRTETELQIYDCDHLCDKGECVENLLSAADAFTPMTPRQSSPAHAVVMRSMLLVLGAVLRSPGASVHAVRSKHAQRCLERLAQLTSIEDLGAAEVLLSFIKLLDEAGRVYAQRALVPIVGERSSLGRLLATGAPAVEPNTDQRVLLAFDTLGRSAVSLGIVREDSYPGFFLSCQRQLGCYLDAGARDTAALKWLAEFVVTPGQKVILRGLETEELNGRKGVVTGPAKAGEGGWRVPVQCDDRTVSVHLYHVRLKEEEEEDSAASSPSSIMKLPVPGSLADEAASSPSSIMTLPSPGTGKNAARNKKRREKMKQLKVDSKQLLPY